MSITRFVVTVEEVDGLYRVFVLGPDRKPVKMAGTNPKWPLDAAAGHMAAVVARSEENPQTGENPMWMHDGDPRAFDPDAGKAA